MWMVPLLHRLVLTQTGDVCDISDFDAHVSMRPVKLVESLHTRATVFTEAYYIQFLGRPWHWVEWEREAKDNWVFVVMGHCTGGLSSLLRTECGPPQPSPLMPRLAHFLGRKQCAFSVKHTSPMMGSKTGSGTYQLYLSIVSFQQ